MAPIGSNERDLAGEALLASWVAALAQSSAPSRLINLATRAQALPGAGTLITGFTVAEGSRPLLIRAAGPGLAPFNVANLLAQPVLTLFNSGVAFQSNTRWNTAPNAAEIRAVAARVGAFALSESGADSALLVTLSPGAYTLQISGANATTGNALVEIYEVP